MILKASQRGGARALANHLLNDKDNDHVKVAEARGFVSEDLFGAFTEIQAVANGTRCKQPVFSLSVSPPKDADVSTEILVAAIDRAEAALGLTGQPRVIVIHEKLGRIHAHAVWSRIDQDKMTAINMPFYKNKLNALSKELYLEHGWELPEGHRTNGWKNPLNFTLAEWQQAKRLDLDPRELKQAFQTAWAASDNQASFKNALEERGYFLAKGDRRGFVALDVQGNVFSVSRVTGIRMKDLEAKLGKPDNLRGVDETREHTQGRLFDGVKARLGELRQDQEAELTPLQSAAAKMKAQHLTERTRLAKKQDERLKKENQARAARFKRGLGMVMDVLTGRLFTVRKENEREAIAGYRRDIAQREQLGSTQLKERLILQNKIDALKTKHRDERARLARQIAQFLEVSQENEHATSHGKGMGFEPG